MGNQTVSRASLYTQVNDQIIEFEKNVPGDVVRLVLRLLHRLPPSVELSEGTIVPALLVIPFSVMAFEDVAKLAGIEHGDTFDFFKAMLIPDRESKLPTSPYLVLDIKLGTGAVPAHDRVLCAASQLLALKLQFPKFFDGTKLGPRWRPTYSRVSL